tara:strand:- start:868 stop:1224 length:357 start_codon:yes stop_codon:yes gene_type:complete
VASGLLISRPKTCIFPRLESRLTIERSTQVANTPQARKRARQNEQRRQHNAGLRSMVRTYIKKTYAAIATGEVTTATAAYNSAVPVIDRMADKGIIHKNKAARHKSRLNAQLKAMATS